MVDRAYVALRNKLNRMADGLANDPLENSFDMIVNLWQLSPGSQPWLKVNADGERFFNGGGTYEGILHADEYQKGHVHYTIMDSNWAEHCQRFEMHGCSRMLPFVNGADVAPFYGVKISSDAQAASLTAVPVGPPPVAL